jgi:tripartite ATP-independent transporter DctP family solute receptor
MRRSILKTLLTIALASTTTWAAAQAPVKFGYGASDTHPQGLGAKRFAELVAAKTNGRLQVNTYASGKLGSDPAMQSATQGATLEMMVGPTSNLVGLIKEYAIFDLPYLVTSYKDADVLLDGPVGQQLTAKLDAIGLVGLAYWENGFRHFTNSKRPVTKLEDFAGLKTRVIQNPVFIETFKAFGANPVPMAFTELYGALESRAVDAQENPPGLIDSQKFYEVQKYLSLTGHVYSPFIVLASKKWFESLPPADKTLVRAAAVEAGVYQRQQQRDQANKLIDALKGKGMQINELAPAELQRLRMTVQPVLAKFSDSIGPDLLKLAVPAK